MKEQLETINKKLQNKEALTPEETAIITASLQVVLKASEPNKEENVEKKTLQQRIDEGKLVATAIGHKIAQVTAPVVAKAVNTGEILGKASVTGAKAGAAEFVRVWKENRK